jgi:hypothetical protein
MKLPVFSSRDAQRMLRKLRIEVEQTKEVHGKFYYEGKLITQFTFPGSHGGRDLSPIVRQSIRKNSRLPQRDFVRLINCPMRYDEYVATLKAKGHIAPDTSDAGAIGSR